MHQNAAASIKPSLDELVAGFKVFEKILIVDIVHLHDVMLKPFKERLVQRKPQHGQDVRDATSLESFSATKSEQPTDYQSFEREADGIAARGGRENAPADIQLEFARNSVK